MPRTDRKPTTETDQGADILERHLAMGGTEVALIKHPGEDLFAVIFIAPDPSGKPVRSEVIVGWCEDQERTASRMMDVQATLCASYRFFINRVAA